MTRHALDAAHYTEPQTLALERERLFGRLWIFVGFSSMVRERNQFFTRKIAGVPVVVQRTESGIRAFLNQCPHRLSAIQTECTGQRPLVCPYHAWSFGAEGQLQGIPNSSLYQFSAEERARIGLRKLHLEEVGQLLFVNLADDPLPLREQFDDGFLETLREVSSHLDTRLIYSCHKVRYNWKLNMENVKDYNHVPFVHPKTFLPVMTAPVRGLAREAAVPSEVLRLLQEGETPELRSLSFPTKAPIQPYKSWFSDLCEGYGDEHAYYNWFIYPNVNFCSVRGEHFLLQQYDPVAPGETDYHLWMMTARRKDPKTDFSALLSTLIRGERNVIGEDTLVLERLQEGLGAHSPPFMHGDYEVQLVRQHLWYRAQVLGRGHEAGDHRRGRARARTGGQYRAGTGTGTPGPGAECCGSTQLRYCASARTLPRCGKRSIRGAGRAGGELRPPQAHRGHPPGGLPAIRYRLASGHRRRRRATAGQRVRRRRLRARRSCPHRHWQLAGAAGPGGGGLPGRNL